MSNNKTDRASLEDYLNIYYPVTISRDPNGCYVAELRDLPGCVAQGETQETVLKNIEEAKHLWIEESYTQGLKIPEPTSVSEYSGRVLVRMPSLLHRYLVQNADDEGVSLNQYIVTLLSQNNEIKSLGNQVLKGLETININISSLTRSLGRSPVRVGVLPAPYSDRFPTYRYRVVTKDTSTGTSPEIEKIVVERKLPKQTESASDKTTKRRTAKATTKKQETRSSGKPPKPKA